MTRIGSARLTLGAVTLLATGCGVSTYTSSDQVGRNRTASYRDVITRDDISDRAPTALNAYEVVQRLRPSWLRSVGTTSGVIETFPQLYRDNVKQIDLEVLRSISITTVEEIRYYTAIEATMQWGTGNSGGAIEVITGGARNRSAVGEGDQGRPGQPPVFRPYEPFPVNPVLQVHGASSVISSPEELGDFWAPSYAFGGGIGLTATRTVTVLAALEYNRYAFQPDRLLTFLETVNGSYRLRSREGTEVRGAPLTILNLYGGFKVHPDWDAFVPYFTAGVGYLRLTAGAFSLTGPAGTLLPRDQFVPGQVMGGDDRENAFSIGFGGGFDVHVRRDLTFFMDGRYVIGLRGPRYTDVTGQLQLLNTQYFPIRAGLTLRLAHLTITEY